MSRKKDSYVESFMFCMRLSHFKPKLNVFHSTEFSIYFTTQLWFLNKLESDIISNTVTQEEEQEDNLELQICFHNPWRLQAATSWPNDVLWCQWQTPSWCRRILHTRRSCSQGNCKQDFMIQIEWRWIWYLCFIYQSQIVSEDA